MNSTKISIIIPVYNVEKWLKRAVKSLQFQSFKDFEVWLIDDGSTDNSGKLCDELCRSDIRFNVIHQENSGAAAARNAAMHKTVGKYIYFMDPDDWCEKPMLYNMYYYAEEHNLQLVITGFYIETFYDKKKYYQEIRSAPYKNYKSQDEFRKNAYKLFDQQLLYAPWNKLYLREHLVENNIMFPNTFWDDLPFNLEVIRDVERVGCMNEHFYHFQRAREEAENTKYRSNMYEKREEENKWMHELYDYWGLHNSKVDEFLARRYSERLVGCIENVTNKNCTLSKQEKLKEIEKMITTPQAIKSFRLTNPKSKMMKLILKPLKSKNVWLTYKEGQFISFVRSRNTKIFARLKANR